MVQNSKSTRGSPSQFILGLAYSPQEPVSFFDLENRYETTVKTVEYISPTRSGISMNIPASKDYLGMMGDRVNYGGACECLYWANVITA